MNLLPFLAPYFERYITLERVNPTRTYDYKARGFHCLPVIDVTLHKPKCTTDTWLYIAVPAGANVAALGTPEKLYVGSQTSDRMFRGDGLGGRNFHHAQMRTGNGEDNPVVFLLSGKKVDIYRASGSRLATAIADIPALSRLKPLLEQRKKHVGYWFEQYILHGEHHEWRWNTASADGAAAAVIRAL